VPGLRLAFVALTAALALAATGCGGSDVGYEEVPGPPAVVTVPEGADALSTDAAASTDDTAADATPTPTADAGASTDSASGTTPTPAAPAATPTPAATATPDSGGAGAPTENPTNNEFDAFCNENPGACD
jgi:hypothetical protein